MTGSNEQPQVSLSDKLSVVTHHHLHTRVPVKLDFDDWNYGSWKFFFEQLCDTYDVTKFIHGSSNGATSSTLTPEEQKVDKIILSWIFYTLSDSLQKRLVNARPKSAQTAWDFLDELVKDNKRARTSALKTELRSIKLGALSMEAYFQKVESLMTTLASLDSPVDDEDVVHYVLDGLPEQYNQVCGFMHYRDTFPDLKTARSLLITEEMRLKSKSLALPTDSSSSSPMVLLTDKGNTRNPTNPQVNSRTLCINHARGYCRYGASCKFVHDPNIKPMGRTVATKDATEEAIITVLSRLGITPRQHPSPNTLANPSNHLRPSAYLTPSPLNPSNTTHPPPGYGPNTNPFIPSLTSAGPPGFTTPAKQPTAPPPPVTSQLAHHTPTTPPHPTAIAHQAGPAHETILPHAFTTGTLQDPMTGAWNMDTGFHDASGSSPM